MRRIAFTLAVAAIHGIVMGQTDFNVILAEDEASTYDGSFVNGSDHGDGFGAWIISNSSSGTFTGSPFNDGMGTGGIGTTAFGFYATSSGYLNATRPFDAPMEVGDQLSFYWAMNWDANGGYKGIDLMKSDGTPIFNVINSLGSTIQINGENADTGYGTTPMLFTMTRTSTGYDVTMTSRSGGSDYSGSVISSDAVDRVNVFIGDQNDGSGQRNIYFNHFKITRNQLSTDATYDNVDIELGESLTIPSGVILDINDVLTIDGDLVNNGTIRLNSDASGTACVGAISTGSVSGSGTFIFERYVPDNANDETSFVNLSSHVAGINASNWTDAGANYIFEYDETNTGGLNDGWVATTGVLTVGKGYMAQFPGTAAITLSYTGALTSGDQTIPATYTSSGTASNDGWNLIGNPYPCAVGFGNLSWTGNTPGGYYVWDEDAGGYNGSAYTVGTIAVGQSFWVQVTADAEVTFQEADKVTGSDPFVRSALDPIVFGLRATEESGKWSRAIRSLDLNATEAFEFGHDMRTLGDPTEESRVMVWFETSDDQSVSIHATHPSDIGPVIVHLFAVEGGDVVLELDPSMEVPEGLCLTLEDTDTGAVYDLTSEEVATVTVQAGTVYNDRFVLHTAITPAPEVTPTWCHQGIVNMGLDGSDLPSWNVEWNGMGQSGPVDGDMISGLLPGTYTLTWDQNGMCAGQAELEVLQPCMGDFNTDGHRGTGDLLMLVAHMSLNANDAANAEVLAVHDCNCDGALGVHDVLTFLTAFGSSCYTIE
ncbi:MAG: hypothetical protein O3B70_07190 [Bacteroidetes bacterium]|nr:hypothetical protein [Bacteroidota bacterium]MDA0904105.1 hypothetical protein [Bacteroidota bacterium]MDA1243129.1 hypothetical protein [Bacteroidota bacterium]